MAKPIDLGKKLGDMVSVSAISPEETHYPDLYISETDDRRLAEMPDEGTATIRYRIRSRTHREEKHGKGKDSRSCSLRLAVLSIEPPEGKKKKNGDSDGGARKALNDYFKDRK